MTQRDILNIDEAADLLGVSVKTFNKVLHAQNIPARKIGREWKFSRAALIEWVGSGRSQDFYKEADDKSELDGGEPQTEIVPHARSASLERTVDEPQRALRTVGWQIEHD